MLTKRQTHLDNNAVSLVVAALLITVVQSESLPDNFTTHDPPTSEHALATELSSGSMEEPRVLKMHSPCREEHVDYCFNGGQCIYPQDTTMPFCECTSSYIGVRCMFLVSETRTASNYEGVIIFIIVGVALLILASALIYFYCLHRRCVNSEGLIKHASENSV